MNRFERFMSRLSRGEHIVLDGAMGTEIQRRGVSTSLPLWSAQALSTHPEVVRKIHCDNIEAGAEIISTNTFRTNERTFLKAGMTHDDAAAMTKVACSLAADARLACGNDDVLIAGEIAPLEDCYRPDLVPSDKELHREHALWAQSLAACAVDFLFVETMNCVRETAIALKEAANTGLPVAFSVVVQPDGTLLSGETIEELLEAVAPAAPFSAMLNCRPPETLDAGVSILSGLCSLPTGVYANGIGRPDDKDGWTFDVSEGSKTYVSYAERWADAGVQIIGGCCGTTLEDIRAVRSLCDRRNREKLLLC